MSEAKVRIEPLRRKLSAWLRLDRDDSGEPVSTLAGRAGVSERSIKRILDPDRERPISIDMADRLLLAIGDHLALLDDGDIIEPEDE